MDSLNDKVVIITGAGSGIGEATAYYFLNLGSKLLLADRHAQSLDKVVSNCLTKNKSAKVTSVVADLTKDEDRRKIVEKAVEVYNQIDVLVNNAGIFHLGLPTEITEKQYDELFEINTKSHVFLTHLVVPHLKASKGNIVNVSSFTSKHAISAHGIYCITKAAIDMYTNVLAVELGPYGVRVNTVNPGTIRTPITKGYFSEEEYENMMKDQVNYHPLGRVGKPDDVAKCIAFLASDMAGFVTGQNLFADGGRHCLSAGDQIQK